MYTVLVLARLVALKYNRADASPVAFAYLVAATALCPLLPLSGHSQAEFWDQGIRSRVLSFAAVLRHHLSFRTKSIIAYLLSLSLFNLGVVP